MKKWQKYIIILSIILVGAIAGTITMPKKKGLNKNSGQTSSSITTSDTTTQPVSNDEKVEPVNSYGNEAQMEQDVQKKHDIESEDSEAFTDSKERYEQKYLEQTDAARIKGSNTYKINNDTCSISYNNGKQWIDVPVDYYQLTTNEGGYAYQNQLQDGSYIITPQKTVIVYGGTKETPLSITYSNDRGKNWNVSQVDKAHELKSVREKQISFVSDKCGYLIVTDEKTMSAEAKLIYKTTDGGKKWSLVKTKTSLTEHLLYRAGFVTEKIGFIVMECQDTPLLYRTKDGGINWKRIEIPLESDEFIQPELPYVSGDKLYLKVGMDKESDIEEKQIAMYESKNKGKSFVFQKTLTLENEEEE